MFDNERFQLKKNLGGFKQNILRLKPQTICQKLQFIRYFFLFFEMIFDF